LRRESSSFSGFTGFSRYSKPLYSKAASIQSARWSLNCLADPAADCPANCVVKTDLAWGATAGFLAGIWTFTAIAIHSLFELKPWRGILINGFYSLVILTLIGAINGVWR
jgi:hypothetical protein